MTATDREPDKLRLALTEELVQERAAIDGLIDASGDPNVSLAQLVDLVEPIERSAERRGHLVAAIREEASLERRRIEERSVRQYVLRALEEVGAPQNAAFVQEYTWARDRIALDTREFGALRRDERRAWTRNPLRRVAFVVPALDRDGRPLARWLARSDWELDRRIVAPQDEPFLDLMKLVALLRARDEQDPGQRTDPFAPLIERYAKQTLGLDWQRRVGPDEQDQWVDDIRDRLAESVTAAVIARAETDRSVSSRLLEASLETQLWGR
jgi:hypothetical protein